MYIKEEVINVRSPQILFDKNTLNHFIAAYYLKNELMKFIKFKILSKDLWVYSGSFAKMKINILFFKKYKKILLYKIKHKFFKKSVNKYCL